MERFDTFTLSIMALNRQVQKIKDLEMSRFGLKGSHVMLMYFLGQNEEGLTSSELSRLCMEDKAAVSRSLSKLETLGIVAPALPNPGKREYRVKRFLTEHGKNIFRQMTARINKVMSSGGNGLSESQKKAMYLTLRTISSNLEKLLNETANDAPTSNNKPMEERI